MTADIELEVSFGATKGLPNYSSERADLRIRLTIHSEAETLPEWLNDSVAVEDQVRNHLVYSVADALGMEAGLNEGGKASLIWPEVTPPAQQLAPPPQNLGQSAAPPPAQQQQQQSGGGGGGGGGGYGPPKLTKEQQKALPRVHMDMGDGTGLKVYVDQRSVKKSEFNQNAPYSAKAPDFKVDEPDGAGYWIKDATGLVNQNVAQAMAAAGVV